MRLQKALIVGLLVTLPSTAVADGDATAKKVVLGMIDAVNQRDFEALDSLVAADVRRYCAATPGVRVESLDQFKAFLRQDLAAVPDAVQKVNLIFAGEGMVAVHVTYRGTQTGPMGPFPPSGKRVDLARARARRGTVEGPRRADSATNMRQTADARGDGSPGCDGGVRMPGPVELLQGIDVP
jgi:predicted ester cyclase